MPSESVLLAHDKVGAGATVLLVHAGIADRRMWRPVVDVLRDRFRILCPDLRGYGESALTTDPFAHHEDLAALLEANESVDAGPAVVIGASMGGAAALDLTLKRPELVRALVLVGSALGGAEFAESALHDLWSQAERAFDNGNRVEAAAIEMRTWLWIGAHELVREMLLRSYELQAGVEGEERSLDPPAAERLGEIRVPTLVVVGEHDRPDIRRFADRLVGEISGARSVEIAGAMHLPSLEQPDAFNLELLSFLTGLVQ